MGLFKSKPAKKPSAVDWMMIGVGLGAAFYFMFTYSGPFQWLAEWQIRVFGSYEEGITLILSMLLIVGPLFAVKYAVRRIGFQSSTAPSVDVTPGLILPSWWNRLLFASLVFGGIGAFMLYQGLSAGPLIKTTIDALEKGERPSSHFVEVQGMAIWEDAPWVEGSGKKFYVPVVSDNWQPKQPVAAYLEVSAKEYEGRTGVQIDSFKGLTYGSLPGVLRTRLVDSVLPPHEHYILINYNSDPSRLTDAGYILLPIAGGLALASLTWTKWRRAKIKRAASVAQITQ
jgi:hypothetical protein